MELEEVAGDIAAMKSKVSGEESAPLCNGDVSEKANGVNGDNSRTDSVTIDDEDRKSGDDSNDSDSGGVNGDTQGEEMNGKRCRAIDEKEDGVMEIDDDSNDSGSSAPVKSVDEISCEKSSVEDETSQDSSQDSLLSGDKSSKVNEDSDCEMIDDENNSGDKAEKNEKSKTDEKKEVLSEKEEEKSKENNEAKEKPEGGDEEKDKEPAEEQTDKKSAEDQAEKKPEDQAGKKPEDQAEKDEEIKNTTEESNDSAATKDKESTVPVANLDPSQIETKAEAAARLKAEEAKKAKFAVMDKPAEITDMRPMAHLLHNIGMDLCRETVYSHLIKVQNKKQSKKQLNNKETDQLEKLKDAHTEIKTKNKAFTMETIKCPICIFRTESRNVLEWHLEFAHGQDDEIYSCSFCRFKTKMPGVFFFHMENEHKRKGRIYMRSAQFSCPLCPFENNKRPTMTKHRQRCEKVFSMKRNLEPSPTDCDIPLKKTKKQLAAAAAAAAGPRATRGGGAPQPNIITRPQPPPLQPRPMGTSILNITQGGKPTVAQTISQVIRGPGRPASATSIQLAAQAIAQQAAQNVLNQQQKTPAIPLSGQIPGGMIPMYPPGTTQAQILAGTVRPTHYAIGNQLYQIVQARGQFMLQPVQQSANFQIRQAAPMQARHTPQQKAEIDLKSALEAVHKNVERKQAEERRRKELAAKAKAGGGSPQFEICEICGGFVKDRDSLHIHFFWAHKVEINKEVFKQQQPHLVCDICRSRFWTFQGLHRHRQISHGIGGAGGNKNIAPPPGRGQTLYKCYMCNEQVTYLATHLSEKHNVSIQEMFKAKKCYVCGQNFDNQKALEKHLVKNHRELLTPQKFNPSPNKHTSPTPTGLFQNTGGRKSKTFTPECSICNIKFASLEKFSQHCNDYHIFKCYRCGEKCATEELLQKHMFDAHRSDTDPCQICKQKVKIGRPYVRHMKNSHLKQCSIVLKRLNQKVVDSDNERWQKRKAEYDRQAAEEAAKKKEEAAKKAKEAAKKAEEEKDDVIIVPQKKKSEVVICLDDSDEDAPLTKIRTPEKDKTQETKKNDKVESDDEAKISAEVMEVDGEKIVIEQQDETDACNNSGTSREEEKPEEEDTKIVIGVAKVETEQQDKAGGDVEMKSECPKCHLPQVKDEADDDNNVNRECCKCRLQQVNDEGSGDNVNDDIKKEAEKNDEKQSGSSDKKKTEELDLEDLMEVEDS